MNPDWVWFNANYTTQFGNDDEYAGTLTFSASGIYSYSFRFSLDNGTNYTAADLNGAGSNGGLAFSRFNLGSASVLLPVPPLAGDADGNGIVSASELSVVLSNYWAAHPMMIQSLTGPPGGCLQFALTNLDALNLSVLATTNITLPIGSWEELGPAVLRYEISDPGVGDGSMRHYLLRWP